LIIFIFLFVIAVAVAILIYMQLDKSNKAREAMEKRIARLASPQDNPYVDQLIAGSPTDTAIAASRKQIEALKLAIDGPSGASTGDLTNLDNGKVKTTLDRVGKKDVSLIAAANALSSDLARAAKEYEALSIRLHDEEAQFDQTKATFKTSLEQATKNEQERKDELVKVNADLSLAKAEKDKIAGDYEKQITTLKEDTEKMRREFVLQIEQHKQEIIKLNNQIATLREAISRLRPAGKTNVAREVDGLIVRAGTSSGECYINLGKRDRVLPGLTFAIYDPKYGVRFDTDAEARGKGGVEVLDVGEAESLCRITYVEKGQTIQAGDLIANPVYNQDKNRKFRFVVYGDFDLDGDGQATSAERERLIRMIQLWGGIVEDKLTTQTDFLVVGARPASPTIQAEGGDQPGGVVDAQLAKQKQYDVVITDAKQSSVPILNANRFFAMIGYYNTTIVHH